MVMVALGFGYLGIIPGNIPTFHQTNAMLLAFKQLTIPSHGNARFANGFRDVSRTYPGSLYIRFQVQFSSVQYSQFSSAIILIFWIIFGATFKPALQQKILQQKTKTFYSLFMSLNIYSHETLDDNFPCDKTPKMILPLAPQKKSQKRKPFLMFYMQRLSESRFPIAAINRQSSKHHRN